jgi:hypothetical protein
MIEMMAAAVLMAGPWEKYTPAHPQGVQVYGPMPSPSCGAWTAARTSRSGDTIAYEYWLMGFVSGRNWFEPSANGGVRSANDPQALEAWVDEYCKAHPLDNLVAASLKLVDELRRRERQ